MNKCQDCDRAADPRYTMDFTDVEPGAFIYWCDQCGPVAHEMNDALQASFDADPAFKDRLAAQIDEAIERRH